MFSAGVCIDNSSITCCVICVCNLNVCTVPGRHDPCGWGRGRWAPSGWAGWCRRRGAPWCQRTAGACGSLADGPEEVRGREGGEGGVRQWETRVTGCWGRRPPSPCWAWSLCSRSPPRRRCSRSRSCVCWSVQWRGHCCEGGRKPVALVFKVEDRPQVGRHVYGLTPGGWCGCVSGFPQQCSASCRSSSTGTWTSPSWSSAGKTEKKTVLSGQVQEVLCRSHSRSLEWQISVGSTGLRGNDMTPPTGKHQRFCKK